jgi:pimeloyl-ACP methyl ester carboxylesterase
VLRSYLDGRLFADAFSDAPPVIGLHGWGRSRLDLTPIVEGFAGASIDLPGFGASPIPPFPWGTEDYADAMAEWLATLPPGRKIWVGHSFGCRVGVQLAARHPASVDALFLIAAAGLPPHRSLASRARRLPNRIAFRVMRRLTPEGPARDRLRERYGSSDYRTAGAMRPVLVKAVTEDLSDVARRIRLPVVLVHGAADTESPPEIAERLHALIPGSQLHLLRGFDHLTILGDGRHQVTHLLGELLGSLK